MPRKSNIKTNQFGERVRELRAGCGLTQQQVADRTTVSVSYISKVENVVIGAGIGATIHPYPTQAEAIRKLGDQYSKTKLTPLSTKVLKFLMKLNVGS